MYQKSQSYYAQFLRYGVRHSIFCHFRLFFATNNLQDQNFEKLKKTPRDIIGLLLCTINESYHVYVFWDMEQNRHNFLSLWTMFSPFTPLTTQRIKIFKKWKKSLEISSFYTCASEIMITCCSSWDVVHNEQMDEKTDRQTKGSKDRKSDI